MNSTYSNIPNKVEVILPESCRSILAQVCESRKITPGEAVNLIIMWACRGIKEHGLGKGADLPAGLDFIQAKRSELMRRADEVLTVFEGHLLDSRALTQEVNRRIQGGAK
jgi:hypothetical protein